MKRESVETGTKFKTWYGGVIIVEKEGITHTVIEPDTNVEQKKLFASRDEQIKDISTYNWITKAERRAFESFIKRMDLDGVQCPKCGNSDKNLLVLNGVRARGGTRVQRYRCENCGYSGNIN